MSYESPPKGIWDETKPKAHSEQDLSELAHYAQTKGIKLYGLKKFDGDSGLLKAMIDQIQELQMDYPALGRRRITIVFGGGMDEGTLAVSTQKTISFNPLALRDKQTTETNLQRMKAFASSHAEDIATHEMGHLLSFYVGNKGVEIALEAYYNVFKQRMTVDEILSYLAREISPYSTSLELNLRRADNIRTIATNRYHEIIPEVLSKDRTAATEFTKEFVRLLKDRAK